jgi:hypothetical protein
MMDKQTEPDDPPDAAYRDAGPFALARMYSRFFKGLLAEGMNRREALTMTVEWLRAITINYKQENKS